MPEENKSLSFIERMKQRALSQQSYGGPATETTAQTTAGACPNCGAGRARQDGLTHCAYCGHAFIQVALTDGQHIKQEDNSKNK